MHPFIATIFYNESDLFQQNNELFQAAWHLCKLFQSWRNCVAPITKTPQISITCRICCTMQDILAPDQRGIMRTGTKFKVITEFMPDEEMSVLWAHEKDEELSSSARTHSFTHDTHAAHFSPPLSLHFSFFFFSVDFSKFLSVFLFLYFNYLSSLNKMNFLKN